MFIIHTKKIEHQKQTSMKYLLPIAGIGALIYSLYKNAQQDKQIAVLNSEVAQYKKALTDLQTQPTKVDATYQVAMQRENNVSFPSDVMIQSFDARKNSTVSSPSTIIKL